MNVDPDLHACAPEELTEARAMAHRAVQLLTKAARANLPPEADDSHSNLGWNRKSRRFHTQPIPNAGRTAFVTAGIWPLTVALECDGESTALPLEQTSFADASRWLDAQLERVGMKPAGSIETPYALPDDVSGVLSFRPESAAPGLRALGSWFDLADALLGTFAGEQAELKPGPAPVRCWPHHFDIATYVRLEEGDFETARGVGVGMSPGDELYDQPYFYVNPWPQLCADALPELPPPGDWHTDGFVGAIATAERVLGLDDPRQQLQRFLGQAFRTSVALLD